MELGVRVAYPEQGGYDWYEALKPYRAVEVAFRDPEWFLNTPFNKILWPWQQYDDLPEVLSIHLPHARITEADVFWRVYDAGIGLTLYDIFGDPDRLVAHPTNAKLESAIECLANPPFRPLFYPEHSPYLCWETFLSKRRFVNTIESIAEAGLYACYDTSHMRRDTEGVLNDLETYKDTIKVVHLSNWDEHGQHLPLREGVLDMRTILVYLDKYFDGPVILEYLQKYHHLYLDDIRWAWEKVLK